MHEDYSSQWLASECVLAQISHCMSKTESNSATDGKKGENSTNLNHYCQVEKLSRASGIGYIQQYIIIIRQFDLVAN